MDKPMTIIVRGSGDVGSAVAHLLFSSGYAVLIQDSAQPGATRRGMAFTDAIFDGTALLENVPAQRADSLDDLHTLLTVGRLIPVTTLELPVLLEALSPSVLVDARMKKHQQPESQIQLAALTIGLGPNFIAGENVHLAVETNRGENLGKVLASGATEQLKGEPNAINGHARDRYIYAPLAGVFHTKMHIGQRVVSGQEIARIEQTPLYAPLDGNLRGLTHDGVPVQIKGKIIEIDPRSENAQVFGIAERPRRIALGVLEGIRSWEQTSSGGS